MNTLQIGQCFPDEKSATGENRRAILLEIARLVGERNITQDRLTWLKNQVSEKRLELEKFDNQE